MNLTQIIINRRIAELARNSASLTTHKLLENFEADGGVFAILESDVCELTGQTGIIANYVMGKKPKIGINVHIDQKSSIAHELRHHGQVSLLKNDFNAVALQHYTRKLQYLEADARTIEVLVTMEDLEALNRIKGTISNEEKTKRYEILRASFELFKHSGCGVALNVFDEVKNQKEPLSNKRKLQILRNVFDSYIKDSQSDENWYRRQQSTYIKNLEPKYFDSAYWIAVTASTISSTLLAAAYDYSLFGMSLMALNVAACGYVAAAKLKTTFNWCANITAEESAGFLEKLGTLPNGEGNYLTETNGPALNSDFYYKIPDKLQTLVNDRQEEFNRAIIPFATTAYNIKTHFKYQ